MKRRVKTEFIATPFVRVRVFIECQSQLQTAAESGILTDESLAIALECGLRAKRRFLLRPEPRDW